MFRLTWFLILVKSTMTLPEPCFWDCWPHCCCCHCWSCWSCWCKSIGCCSTAWLPWPGVNHFWLPIRSVLYQSAGVDAEAIPPPKLALNKMAATIVVAVFWCDLANSDVTTYAFLVALHTTLNTLFILSSLPTYAALTPHRWNKWKIPEYTSLNIHNI